MHLGIVEVARPATIARLDSVSQPLGGPVADFEATVHGLYSFTLPLLSAAAVFGLVASVLVSSVRRRYGAVVILTLACAVAVLVRLGLVALLEVTAWPGALFGPYVYVASPFLISFAICGTFLLAVLVRPLAARFRRPAEPTAVEQPHAEKPLDP